MSTPNPSTVGAPMTCRDSIAVMRNVHYEVDSGKTVLEGLDIDICRGAITAIMGPSGTGKTTLLKLLTGQITADQCCDNLIKGIADAKRKV